LYSTNYPIIDPSSRISEDFGWFFLDRIVSKKSTPSVLPTIHPQRHKWELSGFI